MRDCSLFTRTVLGLAGIVAVASASVSSAGTGLQPPVSGGAATETRHLTITTSSTPAAVKAGQRAVLNVDVALKPRMHVYSPDQPKGQDYLPIVLSITAGDRFRVEKPRYPSSEKLFFAPLQETQHVYSKPFRITQPIVLTEGSGGEPLTVTGTVRYQACDDAICYVPQTVAVKWILPMSGDSRRQEH